MQYFFMSFRDPDKNLSLGVCIIASSSLTEAIKKSYLAKLNPGGEVKAIVLNQRQFQQEGLEQDRLYTRQEMLDLGYQLGGG